MKKIVGINSVNYGSTGNIMINTLSMAEKQGHEVYVSCSGNCKPKDNISKQIFIGIRGEKFFTSRFEKYTGLSGFCSIIGTFKFLKELDKIKPDILHLHNLHGWYINIPMLFSWIKRKRIKVIWTLHDCWAFTGHCPHFCNIGCERWKTGCYECPVYNKYPCGNFDNSKLKYKLKKKWFTGVKDLTIVTPSKWLADLVKQSYLKDYEVRVINNGIDLSVFKPTESDLRKSLGLEGKSVLLGCASPFTDEKGLDVFLKLSEILDDSFKIILVGLTKEQIENLPENIIGIKRTSSKEELARYYTMADIFVNPTKEEVLGLVNLEALACGTPVITFNSGGSPECIDKSCGLVVSRNDIDAILKAIEYIIDNKPFEVKSCIKRAAKFDMYNRYEDYVNLYKL